MTKSKKSSLVFEVVERKFIRARKEYHVNRIRELLHHTYIYSLSLLHREKDREIDRQTEKTGTETER